MTREDFIAHIERDGYAQWGEKNIYKHPFNLYRYIVNEFRYVLERRDPTKNSSHKSCWKCDESRPYRELQVNGNTGKIKKLKIT